MNTRKSLSLLLVAVLVFSSSCDNSTDEGIPPELPPIGSVVIDFDDFNSAFATSIGDKTSEQTLIDNYSYAKIVVGVWNTVLVTTLAVPVASFSTAFAHQAEFLGDAKWQWSYTVNGFASQYNSRLTGQIVGNQVIWEMFVEKNGIDGFEEFLWFSGESQTDGKSGYWILNHSSVFPENMLRIDWTIEGEEIGNIKYTYVRELNNDRETDLFKDSYIIYGLQSTDLDAFYDVHAYDFGRSSFVDTDIEWSRTTYNGRVMAPHDFNDDIWHCWDVNGDDDSNCQ